MFEKFPKVRTELSPAYRQIYAEHYKLNRDGATRASSLSQRMESWMHKKVAADLSEGNILSTLEIGGGTLNQLLYENTQPYDVIEPFDELYKTSFLKDRVNSFYKDIDEIELQKKYNRITSIATFEHITNLPQVVAKTCLHLQDSGTLRVAIPNEGTFLWKLGYSLTTGIEFKLKYGLDYGVLMRHEHVNTAPEIEEVLSYFYKNVKAISFGVCRKIALYRFYECALPEVERAKEYLSVF